MLYTDDVVLEYAEKLLERGLPEEEVAAFVAGVQVLGEAVKVEFFHLPSYPTDADDIAFVLCASNGEASHLVSYDDGLLTLRGQYRFAICRPLVFLRELREVGPR